MKRVVKAEPSGGFEPLLGKRICLFCGIYIYTGVLKAVHDDHIELASPKLVFETGALNTGPWEDAQGLPSPWRVMRQAIESWGPAKC